MITQAELHRQLNYNPETGIFTRKVSNHHSVDIGDVAGSKYQSDYIKININGKKYKAHRLAWLYVYGYVPEYIDHINSNKHDNRICNLRPATKQQNNCNSKPRKDNKSGIKGVDWHGRLNKWRVQIQHNYKKIHAGITDDFFEACCMAISLRNKLHEDFARTK